MPRPAVQVGEAKSVKLSVRTPHTEERYRQCLSAQLLQLWIEITPEITPSRYGPAADAGMKESEQVAGIVLSTT